MNILITGGAGFIGYHTANALAEKGCKVRVLDNLNPQVHKEPKQSLARLHPGVEFLYGDVRNHNDLIKALKDVQVVYHFAAETGVGQSMYNMDCYVDVNVRGTAIVCECLAELKRNIRKLILASSRAVYGEGNYLCNKCGVIHPNNPRSREHLKLGKWDFDCPQCCNPTTPMPTGENALLHPTSVYGITKRTQEELFSTFSHAFEIPTVMLRYFNVYGPGQSLSNPYTGIATIFCTRMLANKPIEIYEDGEMLRDFVDIRDVVQANLKSALFDQPGLSTFNIGSGASVSIRRFAELLKAIICSRSKIIISSRYRIGDIRHSIANISLAKKELGYIPRSSKEEGIKDLVDWAKSRTESSALDLALQKLSAMGLTGVANKSKRSD